MAIFLQIELIGIISEIPVAWFVDLIFRE